MSRSPPAKERPSRLGDYFICCQLGAGGFGSVYLAFDQAHERAVALKLPQPALTESPHAVERFLREAHNLEHLQHPGIVPVYDAGCLDGSYFIALQYIEGTTLADPQARKRLTAAEVGLLIADVAEALDYAHSQGVIHRDVKPSNVLLDLAGRPHLTDFGLAAWEGEPTAGWIRNAGTPEYMAPEQIAGQEPDRRSDVYGLGLVLYELLCGHRAFRADTVTDLIDLIRNVEPVPPRTVKDSVPREMERICLKAIAKLPERRYPTAGLMAGELRAAVQTLASPPEVTLATPTRKPAAPRGPAALLVMKGPTKGPQPGSQLPLAADRITIGREAAECAVHLPMNSVSRRHALILRENGKYSIEDLQSRNGTIVNGAVIKARTALKDQDLIKICDFVVRFQEGGGPDSEEEDEEVGAGPITAVSVRNIPVEVQPAEKLKLLLNITSELTRTFDLEQILPRIVEYLFQAFKQAERAFVIFPEEGTGKLEVKVIKTRHSQEAGSVRFSRSIVRRCLQSGQAFLSEDAAADERIAFSQSLADFRIRSVMCVPMLNQQGDRALGVIQLDTQDRAKKFTEEDLRFLVAVAGQASIALENARMHQLTLKQQVDKVMEQRNMALTTVHSLRQPVMVIHGALLRLESAFLHQGQTAGEATDALADALKSLNRTQEIITGILRFIRPPEVHRLRIEFGDLVRHVVTNFKDLNRQIHVQAALPGEAAAVAVTGDSELLRQALEELLNNAARALQGRGNIQLRARRVKLEDDAPGVRVEVEDDGPGIAAEVRDTLFQPYVTTHAEGKGLGLVFVKYVIEQHRGDVWCEDVSPHGARFVFRLPLAKEPSDG